MHRIRIPLGYNFRHTFVRYSLLGTPAVRVRGGEGSGVAIVWAWWAKSRGPLVRRGPRSSRQIIFHSYLCLCLVHVGETLNRFSDFEL